MGNIFSIIKMFLMITKSPKFMDVFSHIGRATIRASYNSIFLLEYSSAIIHQNVVLL